MRSVLRTTAARSWLLFTIGLGFAIVAAAQNADLRLPPAAVALEGRPDVQIETTRDGATRRRLDDAAAAKHRLQIRVADGRFYWIGAEREPLSVSAAGAFTYLMAREPGKYVRIRQVNDRLQYVEHLDTPTGSVTYWGELRIVLRK